MTLAESGLGQLGAPEQERPGTAGGGSDFHPTTNMTFSKRYSLKPCEKASGGYGVVVQAYDSMLDRTVALKFPSSELEDDDSARRTFLEEARKAARIDNQHVCRVNECGVADAGIYAHLPYIAMEFLDGKELFSVVKERGRLSESETIQLGLQTCDALKSCHAEKIIHCDITPSNLRLVNAVHERLFVKLIDFGISQRIGRDSGIRMAGTAGYRAPEIAITEATDIYGLGAVLHFALTGTAPEVASPNWTNVKVSKQLRAVIGKALMRDPSDRYASVAEMQTALARVGRARLRHRWSLAAGVVLALAMAAVWTQRTSLVVPGRVADMSTSLNGAALAQNPMNTVAPSTVSSVRAEASTSWQADATAVSAADAKEGSTGIRQGHQAGARPTKSLALPRSDLRRLGNVRLAPGESAAPTASGKLILAR